VPSNLDASGLEIQPHCTKNALRPSQLILGLSDEASTMPLKFVHIRPEILSDDNLKSWNFDIRVADLPRFRSLGKSYPYRFFNRFVSQLGGYSSPVALVHIISQQTLQPRLYYITLPSGLPQKPKHLPLLAEERKMTRPAPLYAINSIGLHIFRCFKQLLSIRKCESLIVLAQYICGWDVLPCRIRRLTPVHADALAPKARGPEVLSRRDKSL